jgi:hypothetical protein
MHKLTHESDNKTVRISEKGSWWSTGLLLLILLFPVLVNHDAYRSYFDDDDLGSLNWARIVPLKSYIVDLPCLRYPCAHNRPTGQLFYGALNRAFGLNYPLWAVTLQAIGCINVVLLWLLLRGLRFPELETAMGCLFFASSRALFDAWWKPMFIYDVLCTTFALSMLLAYAHRKWVISFVAFWLAMRSKEIGIVLPAKTRAGHAHCER